MTSVPIDTTLSSAALLFWEDVSTWTHSKIRMYVNSGARIGENAIINTLAGVEHECVIQDGVHVSAGARLGGNVTVGQATTIEIGATVGARVIIGADSVIGAGAVVLRDIPDGVLAYGIPARVIRSTKQDEE